MSWSTASYDNIFPQRPGFESFPAIMVNSLLASMAPLHINGSEVQDAQIVLYSDAFRLARSSLSDLTPVLEFFDLFQFYTKHPSMEFIGQCLGGNFVPRPLQSRGSPQSAALRLAGFFKVFLGLDCSGKNFDAFWIFMQNLPFSPYTSFDSGTFPVEDAAVQLMTAELADFMRLVLLLSSRFSFLYEARDYFPPLHVAATMPLDGPARWIYSSPPVAIPDFGRDVYDFIPSTLAISASSVLPSPMVASSMVMPAVFPMEVAVSL